MRQILVFGDSLTWGADPVTGLRHPVAAQWPMVLEAGLIAAGFPARVQADGIGGPPPAAMMTQAPRRATAPRRCPWRFRRRCRWIW